MATVKEIAEWAGLGHKYLNSIKNGSSFGLSVAQKVQRKTGHQLETVLAMSGPELFRALTAAHNDAVLVAGARWRKR